MNYSFSYILGKLNGRILKPCLTGQTYWSSVLADGLFTDKDTERGNDAVLYSNCIQIGASPVTTTFTGNERFYIDIVRCLHSTDGENWSYSDNDETLYALVDGVFSLIKTGEYHSTTQIIAVVGGEEKIISTFLNSSNDVQEINIEDQNEWENQFFVLGALRTETSFNLTDKIKI